MSSSAKESIELSALHEYLEGARLRVEEALNGYLPRIDVRAETCPTRLAMAMRYSTLGGGKRLRPVLCLMAAEACGGDPDLALPAACALEMVHAYSLIHDDLPSMDDDDLRRGRPTCHRAFDEATAILAGDGLLTLAFELLAREVRSRSAALECVLVLAQAAGPVGMVAGQMADIQAELVAESRDDICHSAGAISATSNASTLESIHPRKNRALLWAPLHMGAVIAEATEASIESLDRYGRAMGLAFQIVDDLLDERGEETKLGKRVGKDCKLGKWTYPRFLGIDGSRRRARQLTDEAVAALEPLGIHGQRLKHLALALLERDR
jgi:geranylgeranyl diphosphate synthase type II